MNRGRGRTSDRADSRGRGRFPGRYGRAYRSRPNGAGGPSPDGPFNLRSGMSCGREKNFQWIPRGSHSGVSERNSTPCFEYRLKKSLDNSHSHTERHQQDLDTSDDCGSGSKESECRMASESVPEGDSALSASLDPHDTDFGVIRIQTGQALGKEVVHGLSLKTNIAQLCLKSGPIDQPFQEKCINLQPGSQDSHEKCPNKIESVGSSGHLEQVPVIDPFDIFLPKTGTHVILKPSLLVKNREKRNEIKHAIEGENEMALRPGMVLLKRYLSISDQAKIAKLCRDLGLGRGGFYQPCYHNGARLNLKMMCLGRNWDPDTSEYGEHRPIDGAKPPIIPHEFHQLVKEAIKDSHAFLEKNSRPCNIEEILPRMSPNICIVNFYSASGRLGLHQDKDESQESLRKGLPVVSFSIGDAAEFLYGDHRDVDKAEKVLLESGDVLIFGGKSRHIFHGVSSVAPNTGPKALLEDTNLRPGRLNLTFREY